ncbi:NAD-dependent epimerase/dehydratase family protein [Gilvimarinus agarilyticus]|uniref:NAD-dependent epimerase/dehydratase family protein n=1 Tax=Gilvimarinus agarilyticus TaxID=679259 RepID=UPI0006989EEE|nr:NAD-dependent epimerase/dehydratase family protein [Gilvimarinus agarilyticus]
MSFERKVLITGANGFVGGHLRAGLLREGGYQVIAGVRQPITDQEVKVAEDLTIEQWCESLQGVDTVIHAAARAHVLQENEADPYHLYDKINIEMTRNLALAASLSGVRRFIFISSIGVNGVKNSTPFTELDCPGPKGAYAWSKYRAEQTLWEITASTAMEVVILRPPLVYGPGVKANFHSMLQWVDSRIPLPLRSVENKRSLLGVENLVDFIEVVIRHPAAANQLFLLADGEDLSTPQLLQVLAEGLGRPSMLFHCPQKLLVLAAKVMGKGSLATKLCGSLQIDTSKAQNLLGWIPPASPHDALMRTAQAFRWSNSERNIVRQQS